VRPEGGFAGGRATSKLGRRARARVFLRTLRRTPIDPVEPARPTTLELFVDRPASRAPSRRAGPDASAAAHARACLLRLRSLRVNDAIDPDPMRRFRLARTCPSAPDELLSLGRPTRLRRCVPPAPGLFPSRIAPVARRRCLVARRSAGRSASRGSKPPAECEAVHRARAINRRGIDVHPSKAPGTPCERRAAAWSAEIGDFPHPRANAFSRREPTPFPDSSCEKFEAMSAAILAHRACEEGVSWAAVESQRRHPPRSAGLSVRARARPGHGSGAWPERAQVCRPKTSDQMMGCVGRGRARSAEAERPQGCSGAEELLGPRGEDRAPRAGHLGPRDSANRSPPPTPPCPSPSAWLAQGARHECWRSSSRQPILAATSQLTGRSWNRGARRRFPKARHKRPPPASRYCRDGPSVPRISPVIRASLESRTVSAPRSPGPLCSRRQSRSRQAGLVPACTPSPPSRFTTTTVVSAAPAISPRPGRRADVSIIPPHCLSRRHEHPCLKWRRQREAAEVPAWPSADVTNAFVDRVVLHAHPVPRIAPPLMGRRVDREDADFTSPVARSAGGNQQRRYLDLPSRCPRQADQW